MHQLGCSTITFRLLDLRAALDAIAAEGFPTIDLGIIAKFCPHVDPVGMSADDHKRVADLIAARGLRVSTCNAWSLTALNRAEGPDVEYNYVRDALRLAAALGCYALSMQPGRKADDAQWPEQARFVTGLINELGAYAKDLGVRLLVECPHMGTLAPTFDQALRFLELIDPSRVGVALDTSHILNGGATMERALSAYGERVQHVHLRDWKGGSIQVVPGEGDIDFGTFFKRLIAKGYQGDFNLELELPNTDVEQYRDAARRAAAHLRPLVA
jgi:sugar phosphate isomerase/epimerase